MSKAHQKARFGDCLFTFDYDSARPKGYEIEVKIEFPNRAKVTGIFARDQDDLAELFVAARQIKGFIDSDWDFRNEGSSCAVSPPSPA
jgi:hypothetical protein